jgi:hypothetical protein
MTEVVERPHLQGAHRMGRAEEYGNLQALSAEVLRLNETKRDFIVDTRRMTFATNDPVSPDDRREGSYLYFDTPEDGHDAGPSGGRVREYAHGQIRERLGIPARYYDKLRAEAPGLLDTNVQHWLSNPKEGRADKRMVRMIEGEVRAFLSNRYRRLDNLDLLERAVLPELQNHGGNLTFHVAALTDEKLYLRVLLENRQREVKVGQIVQAGVQIKNSEVGNGALDISPFIWKLDCLNGMVSNVGRLRRYHVGREQEEQAYAIWRDDTLAAIDAAFFLQVRDAVNEALSETTFELIVRQLRSAIDSEQITEPVAATERLAETCGLGEGEKDSVLRHLALGGDLTKWGTANAVTAAAKSADSFARQEEMESLGFALVTMPATEWSKIAR